MEIKNQVRRRNVKQNDEGSENGESNVTDKAENQESAEATKVEVKNNKSDERCYTNKVAAALSVVLFSVLFALAPAMCTFMKRVPFSKVSKR